MTDKEQIIIDGCNVLKCRYYQYKTLKDCEMRYPESGDCEIGLLNYLFDGNLDMEKLCVDNPNCYFKQLARKAQECEELKQRLKCNCFDPKSNNNRCISYNRIAEDYERDLKRLENKIAECEKYEGAFRRIEKQSKIHCEEICGKSYEACDDKDCLAIQIRDIINKAKDGE